MRGSTKCFSIGDEGSMCPRRGREGQGEGRAGTFRSELTKVRKYGLHHRSRSENWRAWLVGKMKCSSSSDKSRIQANGSAQTLTVSVRSSRSFDMFARATGNAVPATSTANTLLTRGHHGLKRFSHSPPASSEPLSSKLLSLQLKKPCQ